jgi:hypothetical protein
MVAIILLFIAPALVAGVSYVVTGPRTHPAVAFVLILTAALAAGILSVLVV